MAIFNSYFDITRGYGANPSSLRSQFTTGWLLESRNLFMGTQHVFLRILSKAVRCEFDFQRTWELGKNDQTPARCFHIRRLSKVDSLTALDVSALCIEKSSGGRWMRSHLGSSEKDK